jgi:Na+-transporting methylmalonyl-CoA/oxaloacetate decarboxylase gamma subunit
MAIFANISFRTLLLSSIWLCFVTCFRDPYEILKIKRDSTEFEIKSAYRELAKKYHPDKNAFDENAQKKFIEVSTAYEQLRDKAKDPSSSQSSGRTTSRQHRQSHQQRFHDAQREYFEMMQSFRKMQQERSAHFEYRFHSFHHQHYQQQRAPQITFHDFVWSVIGQHPTFFLCVLVFCVYSLGKLIQRVLDMQSIRYAESQAEASQTPTLPIWTRSSSRQGLIAIICSHHHEQELYHLRWAFRTDRVHFFRYDDADEAVIAVSKGGLRWSVKPVKSDIESWLVKVIGGEVIWNLQSDLPCPVNY